MKKSYEMDMCSGPLLSKILIFSIPLMISGILQLLFNAADIVVVGRFTGSEAMAAVGSTGALINLIINLFVGISVGANVVVARNYGARDYDGVHGAVHTSVLTALIGGVFLIFVGIALARPLLELMAPRTMSSTSRCCICASTLWGCLPSCFTTLARPSSGRSATPSARFTF